MSKAARYRSIGLIGLITCATGCASSSIPPPSPTLAELESGEVWVRHTVDTEDSIIYGVAYVATVPIDIAWKATIGFHEALEASALVKSVRELDSPIADSKAYLVTWANGSQQEFVVRQKPHSRQVDVDFASDRQTLGQMAHCSIAMHSFNNNTLVRAEIRFSSSGLKRFLDVIVPPLGLIEMFAEGERLSHLEEFWREIAETHRQRARTMITEIPPTKRVHIIAIGVGRFSNPRDWPQLTTGSSKH